MKFLLSVVFLCGALAPSLVWARDSVPLDPIVVTATRTEIAASSVIASQVIITREEIDRAQASDLAELLRFAAGLELGRNGGVGQVSSIFTRGGNSNHTSVLVDGVAINPGSGFAAAVQNISPDLIERIEIIKGPRSTLYGSSAIAGVINIITRKSARVVGANASLRRGSHDTRIAAGELAFGDQNAQVSLRGENYRSEGYALFTGAPNLKRGSQRDSLNFNAGSRIGPVALALRGWQSSGTVEYVDFFGTPVDQDFSNGSAQLELSATPRAGWDSRLSLSRASDQIDQNQTNFLGDLDSLHSAHSRADWFNSFTLSESYLLSLGLAYEREEVNSLSFGTRLDERTGIKSAAVQNELRAGKHQGLLGVSYADHEAFGGHATWNAEYAYSLLEQTRLSASAGTGFRAPSADERLGFFGNPALKPEQSRSYELGLRQSFGAHYSTDLRLFRNEVDDLINSTCVSLCGGPNSFDDVFQNQNLGETENTGAELALRANYAAVSARLSLLHQDPKSTTSTTGAPNNGRELLRRAKNVVSGSVSTRWSRYTLTLDALGASERQDFGASLLGYGLVNLTAAASCGQHLTLRLRAENILDKDYQTAANYKMPGAQGFLSLDWRY